MAFLKHHFLLFLLLTLFFFKGLIFTSLIPMHQGSDEYIHYATVQHFAEPEEKTWTIIEETRTETDSKQIPLYHYTEEIQKFSELTKSWNVSGAPYNTENLSAESVARIEAALNEGGYGRHIYQYPPDIAKAGTLSHKILSYFEKLFESRNPFVRYEIARLVAIFYGLVIITCVYYIALWSGLKRDHGLLLAGIVAFHPQLTATTSIINYDPLLIAAYSCCILFAVSILRHKLRLSNTTGLLASAFIATLAKATGGILFILVAIILFWGLREKSALLRKISWKKAPLISLILATSIFFLAPQKYTYFVYRLPYQNSEGETLPHSLLDYVDDGIFDSGKFERTSSTYWGTFGWLDTTLHGSIMTAIRLIQYLAIPGVIIFLFLSFVRVLPFRKAWKKLDAWTRGYFAQIRDYLPEAKYAWLFLFSIVLLQGAIRFYDWQGRFLGDSIGTPGRYFLPNIIPHFMLLVIGFGMLVRSERALGIILRILLVLMVLLNLYSIFWIIIPRYYL